MSEKRRLQSRRMQMTIWPALNAARCFPHFFNWQSTNTERAATQENACTRSNRERNLKVGNILFMRLTEGPTYPHSHADHTFPSLLPKTAHCHSIHVMIPMLYTDRGITSVYCLRWRCVCIELRLECIMHCQEGDRAERRAPAAPPKPRRESHRREARQQRSGDQGSTHLRHRYDYLISCLRQMSMTIGVMVSGKRSSVGERCRAGKGDATGSAGHPILGT